MKSLSFKLLTTIFAVSFSTHTLSGTDQAEVLYGRWSPDCNSIQGLKVVSSGTAELDVNSNQIYIEVRLSAEKNHTNVYLEKPLDLGLGGMKLDWKNFSSSRSIGRITDWSTKKLKFQWIGFYNKKDGQAYWKTNPDFMQTENAIFYKCGD